MEVNEQIVYICNKCSSPLDEATMHLHPCLQINADADQELMQSAEGAYDNENSEYLEEEPEPEAETEDIREEQWSATRRKGPTKSRRGEWSDADVQRLIEVYMKNCRALPQGERLHPHILWDRVMRDLKPYGNFSRFLVQAKIKKLKRSCRAILDSGSTDSKWPYYNQVCELIRVESETGPYEVDTAGEETDSENDPLDDAGDAQVSGLRRWTIKETRHLIEVYKKHLPQFFIKSGNRRKIAWNEIIADLEYDLPKRFSMYQIRAKIRNVQNTYRCIVEKKRKRQSTHWPLFRSLAELAELEHELTLLHGGNIGDMAVTKLPLPEEDPSVDNGDDDTTDVKGVRWNTEETHELISAYKDRLFELSVFASTEKKNQLWQSIVADVNSIRRRKINVRQAEVKISLLRTLYEKRDEKALAPLYTEVKEMVEAEESILFDSQPEPVTTTVNQTPTLSNKKRARARSPSPGDPPESKKLPPWFVAYSRDAQRRHEEKLSIQRSIIDALENILLP